MAEHKSTGQVRGYVEETFRQAMVEVESLCERHTSRMSQWRWILTPMNAVPVKIEVRSSEQVWSAYFLTYVNMSVLPQIDYAFMLFQSKSLRNGCLELDKIYSKVYIEA